MDGKRQGGRRLDPAPRRRRRWIPVLIVLVLLLAALALAAALGLNRGETPGEPAPGASSTQTSGTVPDGGTDTGGDSSAGGVPAPDSSGGTDGAEEPLQQQPGEDDPQAAQAQALLEGMTLREKVLQMFIVTPEQLTGVAGPVTQCGDTSVQAIQDNPVGGVIYFADNLQDRDQTAAMIAGLQEAAPLGLFISVDEEGGTVARLGRNPAMGTTDFPDMAEIGATGDPQQAYSVGLTLGTELGALGFNLDFAPVADVYSNPDNPVIGHRAFSSDPDTAAEMVAACVEGFGDSGTLCVLKHFPGHGDTATDSHYGAALSHKTLEELEQCEFIPFRAGMEAGAEVVMVGHIALPAVTGEDTPACLSREIATGLLREQLGFEGLAVTDSLSMQAITDAYTPAETAVLAVQAGMDLLLMPEDLEGAVEGILDAVESGQLRQARIDESVMRILSVKLDRGIISPAQGE